MAEEVQIGFLFQAASLFPQSKSNPTQTLLKSYYLMRCRNVAKEHGLPNKYFSSKVRCQHCFVEWKTGTETRVQAIKLSKRQRKKIRHLKLNNKDDENIKKRKELLKSNEMVQTCSFCKHSEITPLQKPCKIKPKRETLKSSNLNKAVNEKSNIKKVETKTTKPIPVKNVNVYSTAKDVYSLSNKNNTLSSAVKEQKVIKNNKKKKDKFAGLCQQAVLASAKLKQEKDKQNKLNLFLKPSS